MDFVKKNAKSIVTFLVTVIAQAISGQVESGKPLPNGWADWLSFLGTALVAAGLVWLTGNKQDLGQVINSTSKLNQDEQKQVAQSTLDVLPNPVSDSVVASYPNWVK